MYKRLQRWHDYVQTVAPVSSGETVDWVRFNVPPNTLQVISGTGFYGSTDLTNSVKAMREGPKD